MCLISRAGVGETLVLLKPFLTFPSHRGAFPVPPAQKALPLFSSSPANKALFPWSMRSVFWGYLWAALAAAEASPPPQ